MKLINNNGNGVKMKERILAFINKFYPVKSDSKNDAVQAETMAGEDRQSDLFDFMQGSEPIQKFGAIEIIERDGKTDPNLDSDTRISIITPIDEKHYNKLGFYCALEEVDEPNGKFEALVHELKKQNASQIEQVTEIYERRIQHIDYKINLRETSLGEEKDNLKKHREQTDALLQEREKLQNELVDLKKAIHAAFHELAEKKRDLVNGKLNERLEEIDKELKTIIEKHKLLAEEKYGINKRIFEDNKDSLKLKVERFTELREEAKQSYDIIKKKIRDLSRSGFSYNAVLFLSRAGVLGLIAAGWFYSVFILSTNIQSEDYFSFFLRRIITFGDVQFSNHNPFMIFGIFLVGLIVLLALISGAIWLTQYFIQGRKRDRTQSEIALHFHEGNKFAYQTQISSSSVFNMWMQIVPYFLIIGVIFILITLFGSVRNGDSSDLANLLQSLSGQFVGAVIALIATGAMILYIGMIIEPRMQNQADVLKSRSNLLKNWELIASMILFFSLMIFILIPGNNFTRLQQESPALLSQSSTPIDTSATATPSQTFPAMPDSQQINVFNRNSYQMASTPIDSTIAIASFVVIVMFTALSLGYGIKYRGLYQQARNMEHQIKMLSYAIEDNSRPVSLNAKTLMSGTFEEKYDGCLDDFFGMVKEKNRLAAELLNDKVEVPAKRRIHFWRFRKNKDLSVVEERNMTTIEEKYFPESKQIIDDLKSEWQSKNAELEKTKKKIEEIETRQSELENTILQKIQSLESSLINFRRGKILVQEKWHKTQKVLQLNYEKNLYALHDGYNLGLLFKGNNNPDKGKGHSI